MCLWRQHLQSEEIQGCLFRRISSTRKRSCIPYCYSDHCQLYPTSISLLLTCTMYNVVKLQSLRSNGQPAYGARGPPPDASQCLWSNGRPQLDSTMQQMWHPWIYLRRAGELFNHFGNQKQIFSQGDWSSPPSLVVSKPCKFRAVYGYFDRKSDHLQMCLWPQKWHF